MNLIGLFLSFLLLFVLFIIALTFPKINISRESTRKVIHIGISNWWFIAMFYFTDFVFILIPPVIFIFLNYLSFRFHLLKGIERDNKNELGTIYYPLSILILVVFSFGLLNKPYIGAIGILVLGYGDGLATLVGKLFGKKKLYKNKTVIGSLTMFIVSFTIIFMILYAHDKTNYLLFSVIVALAATSLELFSFKGLDNLTVPLLTAFFYYLLTLIV